VQEQGFNDIMKFLFGSADEGTYMRNDMKRSARLGDVSHSIGEAIADDFCRGADRFFVQVTYEEKGPVLHYYSNRGMSQAEVSKLQRQMNDGDMSYRYNPRESVATAWERNKADHERHDRFLWSDKFPKSYNVFSHMLDSTPAWEISAQTGGFAGRFLELGARNIGFSVDKYVWVVSVLDPLPKAKLDVAASKSEFPAEVTMLSLREKNTAPYKWEQLFGDGKRPII
jgi:hypothetical protein